MISEKDERLLERYFGPLEAVFRRSTFGAMIERLDGDSHMSIPCQRCGGMGFTDEDVHRSTYKIRSVESLRRTDWEKYREICEDAEPKCTLCFGSGLAPVDKPKKKAPRTGIEECTPCGGSGTEGLRRLKPQARRSTRAHRAGLLKANVDCEACGGEGFVDVQPAFDHKVNSGGGYEASHEELREYARVSRMLDAVAELDARALVVLETFYGDEGARWGRTRQGRIFALYKLTKAGRQLLARDGGSDLAVSASERLANERDLELQQAKPGRRQLLNAADEQARALYEQACRVWVQAHRDAPDPTWEDEWREFKAKIAERRREAEEAA